MNKPSHELAGGLIERHPPTIAFWIVAVVQHRNRGPVGHERAVQRVDLGDSIVAAPVARGEVIAHRDLVLPGGDLPDVYGRTPVLSMMPEVSTPLDSK
jgi:hypothetical protein